jgi:hypothetical protein
MKCDYYDESDSSGKSYNEIFVKKNKWNKFRFYGKSTKI